MNKVHVIDSLRKQIKKYKPLEAYVYGSYAYGNPTPESDLDLLLISDQEEDAYYKSVAKGLSHYFEMPLEILIIKSTAFKERLKWNGFLQTIHDKGIKIYG